MALMESVELLVVRHDQVRVAGDLEAAAIDAFGLEHVHFGDQHTGIDDHSIADHRRDVVVEDAAGDELQGERLTVDDERVTRIVATLVADDHLHFLGDEVGELPLSLVSPLSTDDDGRGHGALLSGTPLRDLRYRARLPARRAEGRGRKPRPSDPGCSRLISVSR